MRTARARFVVCAIGLVAACGGGSVPPAAEAGNQAVEGVWRLTELTTTGPTPHTLTDPASVFIFRKTHYAMMFATGAQPRTSFEDVSLTNDERIGAYDSFIANAGAYDLSGSTLTTRPIIAKHPNFMSGGVDTYEVRREGEMLLLTGSSANIRSLFNDQLVSSPAPRHETRLRLVRLE